jgi:hypothetical protein
LKFSSGRASDPPTDLFDLQFLSQPDPTGKTINFLQNITLDHNMPLLAHKTVMDHNIVLVSLILHDHDIPLVFQKFLDHAIPLSLK